MKGVAPLGIARATIAILVLAAAPRCLGQTNAAAVNQRQTAIVLEQAGKNAEAETAWRAFLKMQPANAEAYAHLGFLEARQQRCGKSEHESGASPLAGELG